MANRNKHFASIIRKAIPVYSGSQLGLSSLRGHPNYLHTLVTGSTTQLSIVTKLTPNKFNALQYPDWGQKYRRRKKLRILIQG